MSKRALSSIIQNEAKVYAIYTVEQRAIPNMIDGLKPAQRFVIYRALELAKGNKAKMHKLASVAGGVADAGYHHGEVNAQDAGAKMANTWDNNLPLLDGQGNFGSRLVKEAAASRYVFCRISENFRKVYKDIEVAPEHEDKEHLPPKFYLPIIPTVLINGVNGIGTGYATTILPHSVESVVKATKQALNGEEITEPQVTFPKFTGEVISVGNHKYELHGKYRFTARTQMIIDEIPYAFDRVKYVTILDDLEEKGFITYDDLCSKSGFGFKIKFKKDYVLPTDPDKLHKKIMEDFKLIGKITQNIVVVDHQGKVDDTLDVPSKVIAKFVEVRKGYVQKRIDYMIEAKTHEFKLAVAKTIFIMMVNNGSIVIKGKSRSQLKEEISKVDRLGGFEDQLVSMNIYHMTDDESERLTQVAKDIKTELEYWKNTTPVIEYNKDLDALI